MSVLTGPYLKAALICQTVIEGKDGVLSIIRVVDRLTVMAAGHGAPQDMPANDQPLVIVLMFVSGRARGSLDLQLLVEPPDGQPKPVWAGNQLFEGEDRGANVVVQLNYKFEKEGLYWFNVQLDDELVTRIPYRVIYQRNVPGMLPQ